MRSKQFKLAHITTVPITLRFLTGQIRYMKRQGFEVHTVSSSGQLLPPELDGPYHHVVTMHRRITPLEDLAAVWGIWRLFKRIEFDIVHAHTPKAGLLAMIGAWLAGTPARIYHIHGMPFISATGYRRFLLRESERIACRLAHRVLCVGHSIRQEAVNAQLCPPSKITVPGNGSINGVDATNWFHPDLLIAARQRTREQLGLADDDVVAGFVGRIVRDKGIVELSKAWESLREAYPKLHLLLVGPLEPYDPISQETRQQLESDLRIHLTGTVEDPAPMYASMDVFVLPTHREGFPVSALEAAAVSLPVVATAVPGCVEAVRDGETGTLIPPYNVPALINALRTYIDYPALRVRHGRAARARVLAEFRPQIFWDATYQEYQVLLSSTGISR